MCKAGDNYYQEHETLSGVSVYSNKKRASQRRRMCDLQSLPPLYEIEISSGLFKEALVGCLILEVERPQTKGDGTHLYFFSASSTTDIDTRSWACTSRRRGVCCSPARKELIFSLSSRLISRRGRRGGSVRPPSSCPMMCGLAVPVLSC